MRPVDLIFHSVVVIGINKSCTPNLRTFHRIGTLPPGLPAMFTDPLIVSTKNNQNLWTLRSQCPGFRRIACRPPACLAYKHRDDGPASPLYHFLVGDVRNCGGLFTILSAIVIPKMLREKCINMYSLLDYPCQWVNCFFITNAGMIWHDLKISAQVTPLSPRCPHFRPDPPKSRGNVDLRPPPQSQRAWLRGQGLEFGKPQTWCFAQIAGFMVESHDSSKNLIGRD